ncbi:hypothetical protein [Shewanella gaetbuli]
MRFFKYLIPVILVSGCASTAEDKVDSKLTAAKAQQHISVAVLLAKYHCVNGVWPENISQLQAFGLSQKLPHRDTVDFKVTENVYLRTPQELPKGIMSVSSVNEPPVCNGDDIEIKVTPTLGG